MVRAARRRIRREPTLDLRVHLLDLLRMLQRGAGAGEVRRQRLRRAAVPIGVLQRVRVDGEPVEPPVTIVLVRAHADALEELLTRALPRADDRAALGTGLAGAQANTCWALRTAA